LAGKSPEASRNQENNLQAAILASLAEAGWWGGGWRGKPGKVVDHDGLIRLLGIVASCKIATVLT
jgi:hypothetical protein